MKYVVYTDGSGTTGGPAGIAYVALDEDENETSDSLPIEGTNQVAEIMAACFALHQLPDNSEITLYSDSQYLVKGFTDWSRKWLISNWKSSSGDPVKNQRYWKLLLTLATKHDNVQFKWLKGHSGIYGNEKADKLAGIEREKQLANETNQEV